VWRLVGDLTRRSPFSLESGRLNPLIGVVGLVLVVAGLVCLARWRPPLPVAVYTAFALLIPVTSAVVGPRPRMLLAAFPLAVFLATRLRGRSFRIVLGLSIVGLLAITMVTSTTLAATP
jgi:hypothetical protein